MVVFISNDRKFCIIPPIGNSFSWDVAARNTSVRVPRQVNEDECGYLEDRRPAANIDPYLVTSKIFETTVLSTVSQTQSDKTDYCPSVGV